MTGNVSFSNESATDKPYHYWKPEEIKLIFRDGTPLICPLNRWMANKESKRYPTILQFECFTSEKGMHFSFSFRDLKFEKEGSNFNPTIPEFRKGYYISQLAF